jgi:hypothetical protein
MFEIKVKEIKKCSDEKKKSSSKKKEILLGKRSITYKINFMQKKIKFTKTHLCPGVCRAMPY